MNRRKKYRKKCKDTQKELRSLVIVKSLKKRTERKKDAGISVSTTNQLILFNALISPEILMKFRTESAGRINPNINEPKK